MIKTEASNQALRKKITGRALIIFVVTLLLLTFFSNTINNLTLPRVTVENPMPGDIVKEISGQGTVEAKETQEKYISSNSMVEEVKVKVGDHVKKGQVIMVLDTKDLEKSLKDETDRYGKQKLQLEKLTESSSAGEFNTAEKNVRDAEKKLEQKQKDFDSAKELYEMGAESKKNLDAAEAGLEEAKQALDAAKFSREQASKDNERDMKSLRYDMDIQQRSMEKLKEELNDAGAVCAPCDGIISDINFDKGTMTNSSQPLFKITDTTKGFQLKVVMDEEKARYLTVGEEADVMVESVGRMPVEGRITEITENEQQKGEKKDVYISMEMKGLTGGEPGEVNIRKRMEVNGFLVSNDAVHTDENGDYILVVREKEGALGKESYVQEARITTGESDNTRTAVTGGMMMERIIIKSSKSVEDGDRVIVEK